jgi:hypothetical protein
LLHQTTTNSAVRRGNSSNQTNTGQIENVGIWTDSRKAEHRSRTGPDSLLQKRRGGRARKSGKQFLEFADEEDEKWS